MSFHLNVIGELKKTLQKEGFSVEYSDNKTIDLIAKDNSSGKYYFFEAKSSPISTLDVSKFKSAIRDTELENVLGYIITNSIPTGSACELSNESKIEIIKIDNLEQIKNKLAEYAIQKSSTYPKKE